MNIVGGAGVHVGPTKADIRQNSMGALQQGVQLGAQFQQQMDADAWKRIMEDPMVVQYGLDHVMATNPDHIRALATGRVFRQVEGVDTSKPAGTVDQLMNAQAQSYMLGDIVRGQADAGSGGVPNTTVSYNRITPPAQTPTSTTTPTPSESAPVPGGLNEPELKAINAIAHEKATSTIQWSPVDPSTREGSRGPQGNAGAYWYLPPGAVAEVPFTGTNIPRNAIWVSVPLGPAGRPDGRTPQELPQIPPEFQAQAASAYRTEIMNEIEKGNEQGRMYWDDISSRIGTYAQAIDERQLRLQSRGGVAPDGGYYGAPPAVARSYQDAYPGLDRFKVPGAPATASAPAATVSLGDKERDSFRAFLQAYQASGQTPSDWERVGPSGALTDAELQTRAREQSKAWEEFRTSGTLPSWATAPATSAAPASASSMPTPTLASGKKAGIASANPTASGIPDAANALATAFDPAASARDKALAKRELSVVSQAVSKEVRPLWRSADTVEATKRGYMDALAGIATRLDPGGSLADHPAMSRAVLNFTKLEYDKGVAETEAAFARAGLDRAQASLAATTLAVRAMEAQTQSAISQSELAQKTLGTLQSFFSTTYGPFIQEAAKSGKSSLEISKMLMEDPNFKALYKQWQDTFGLAMDMGKSFEIFSVMLAEGKWYKKPVYGSTGTFTDGASGSGEADALGLGDDPDIDYYASQAGVGK